ncbi:hypothetical protein, partial [Bacillus anthracis]|uniref:hypothetical protein n=3 Tax=Bacillus anthracis TaxID=1392 RepID=UPI001FD85402
LKNTVYLHCYASRYNRKNEVTSDNGFFVIELPNTQWLLTRNIKNDSFEITYLTKNLFENEIAKLIKD